MKDIFSFLSLIALSGAAGYLVPFDPCSNEGLIIRDLQSDPNFGATPMVHLVRSAIWEPRDLDAEPPPLLTRQLRVQGQHSIAEKSSSVASTSSLSRTNSWEMVDSKDSTVKANPPLSLTFFQKLLKDALHKALQNRRVRKALQQTVQKAYSNILENSNVVQKIYQHPKVQSVIKAHPNIENGKAHVSLLATIGDATKDIGLGLHRPELVLIGTAIATFAKAGGTTLLYYNGPKNKSNDGMASAMGEI